MIAVNLRGGRDVWTIYNLTSPSRKVYIGQTLHPVEYRWHDHEQAASCGEVSKLYHAVRKYGWASFSKNVLEYVLTPQEADAAEIRWIEHYDSVTAGYNTTWGGRGFRQKYCHRGHDLERVGRTHRRSCAVCDQNQRVEYRERTKQQQKEWRTRRLQDPAYVERMRREARDRARLHYLDPSWVAARKLRRRKIVSVEVSGI